MIGAALAAALPGMRAQAESMMFDTVSVTRGSAGFSTPDPITGDVSAAQTTVYSGKGRVKPMKRITAGGVNAGEIKDSQSIFIVSLPHSATGVHPGDIVHVTASSDADLLTDTFRVMVVEDSAQTTARRLTCELMEARQ